MCFVSHHHQKETFNIENAMFCIISQSVTKYFLWASKVDESFLTQKQSCVTQKLENKSDVCFLIFSVLVGTILFSLTLQKRTTVIFF